jgi:hypothetical protein
VPPRRPSALAQHENGNSELVAASEMWSEPVPAVLPRPAEASKLDNWPDLRRNNVLPQGIRFRGAHRLSDRGPCGSSQPRGSSKSRRRECYGVPLGRVCEVCGTGHSCADLPGLWQAYPNQIFTAIIFGSDRTKFGAPEISQREKQVCVTGEIFLYHRKTEIILRDPKQLSGIK